MTIRGPDFDPNSRRWMINIFRRATAGNVDADGRVTLDQGAQNELVAELLEAAFDDDRLSKPEKALLALYGCELSPLSNHLLFEAIGKFETTKVTEARAAETQRKKADGKWRMQCCLLHVDAARRAWAPLAGNQRQFTDTTAFYGLGKPANLYRLRLQTALDGVGALLDAGVGAADAHGILEALAPLPHEPHFAELYEVFGTIFGDRFRGAEPKDRFQLENPAQLAQLAELEVRLRQAK